MSSALSTLFSCCFCGQFLRRFSLYRCLPDDMPLQVGVFPKFAGEEFEKYNDLAEKLRSDYDFGHTLDAKLLPRGESSVTGPLIRLFKPFDELFVDFKVLQAGQISDGVHSQCLGTIFFFF